MNSFCKGFSFEKNCNNIFSNIQESFGVSLVGLLVQIHIINENSHIICVAMYHFVSTVNAWNPFEELITRRKKCVDQLGHGNLFIWCGFHSILHKTSSLCLYVWKEAKVSRRYRWDSRNLSALSWILRVKIPTAFDSRSSAPVAFDSVPDILLLFHCEAFAMSSASSCPPPANVSAALPPTVSFRYFFFPNWDQPPLLQFRKALAVLAFLLLVVGFIGNILTFFTLWRYQSLRISTRIFFFGIACGDLLGMPLHMFYVWYHLQFAKNFANDSNLLCTAYVGLAHWGMTMSWCCLATVAVERFLLVWLPQKMRGAKPKRYAVAGLLLNLFLSGLVGLANFGYAITEDCICVFVLPNILNQIRNAYLHLLYTVVAGQVIFSGLALKRILGRRNLSVRPQSEEENKAFLRKLSPVKMSLAVGLSQCVSILPYALFLIKDLALGYNKFLISAGTDLLLYDVALIFLTANFGANFFIYCLVSHGFKTSFFSLFRRKRDWKGLSWFGIEADFQCTKLV